MPFLFRNRICIYKFKIPVLLYFIAITFIACSEKPKTTIPKPYNGPSMVVYNLITLLTDSAQPKITLKSPEQIEYENGNRVFPKGVNIEFFGEKTQKSSILTAKHGKFNRDKNLYTVTRNVVIVNKEEAKTLNTEELHWNPGTKKIFTDKFVRIETPTELLTGTGLESNEDFSSYRILKVSGVFPLGE